MSFTEICFCRHTLCIVVIKDWHLTTVLAWLHRLAKEEVTHHFPCIAWHNCKEKEKEKVAQGCITLLSATWSSTFSLCQTQLHRWMNDLKAWLMLLLNLYFLFPCFHFFLKTALLFWWSFMSRFCGQYGRVFSQDKERFIPNTPLLDKRCLYFYRAQNQSANSAHTVMNLSALWTDFKIYGKGSLRAVVKMKSWHLNMLPIKYMKTEAFSARNNSV